MQALLVGLGMLALVFALPGHAQFWERLGNPTVAVEVVHPPGTGLIADQIVLGPVRGDCANELVRILARQIDSRDLPVIGPVTRYVSRSRYDREFADYVERAAAVEVGRWPGAAMVALDVRRCATEAKFSEYETKTTVTNEEGRQEDVLEKTYHLRAHAVLELTLRVVDLTTGRTVDDRSLAYSSANMEASSTDGYPEEPAALDLLAEELDGAAGEIRRLFRPWTETVDVVFFDDRDCGLRNSYRALRRGDMEQALALSEQNLVSCEQTPSVEPKLLARAHYNVGIMHLLRGGYGAALAALRAAEQLRSSSIVRQGIATVRKAQELAASMADLEQRERVGRTGPDVETLRNADVIRMVREDVPTSIILSKVARSRNEFDTSTPAIIALVDEGIDEKIIKAMLTAD